MCDNRDYAIGVFDSGLGGLTVVRELMKTVAHENIVYYGDTARVPYGTKSKETIIRFSKENVSILLKHKVKMIVVACNSSSSYALEELKACFDLPIVGVIEPGVKKAVLTTANKKIGIIATPATIASGQYTKNIQRCDSSMKIYSQACPLFVPLAEEGWLSNAVTLEVARAYLAKLKRRGIDTLILGCTHYPLLKRTIKKIMGPKVTLVDSAREVAEDAKCILERMQMHRTQGKKGQYKFLVSDKPQNFKRIAKKFLGMDVKIDLELANV